MTAALPYCWHAPRRAWNWQPLLVLALSAVPWILIIAVFW